MDNLINQLKINNPDLTKAQIRGILFLIVSRDSLTNNELIRLTGLPKETLKLFKNSISRYLKDTSDDSVAVQEESKKEWENLDLKPYSWSILKPENKTLKSRLIEIREKYRLVPKREYDQFFATEETSVAKALILKEKGLIEGNKIALLGDDDLVSIVLGLMEEDYLEITVFDIDDTLLSVIRTISRDLNLKNIRTEVLDVRKEMKDHYLHSFDIVITDPPYTRDGVFLFLNTSVKLIKKFHHPGNGYIFLYYGNSFKSPEKTLKIQEVIGQQGLMIEDKIDKFARYYGAESIGSASSLYVLKTTPYTQTLDELSNIKDIYTYESQKEEKFPYVSHYTFKLTGIPPYIIESRKALLKLSGDFCEKHKIKVIDTKITRFKGKGLSITFILGSSNFLVHTWPEYSAIHMDLVTCSPIFNKDSLLESISSLFEAENVEMKRIE